MRQLAGVALGFVVCLGCSGKSGDTSPLVTDTAPTEPTTEPPQSSGCDVVEFDYDGPDDPVVGDEWTVWLRCDGALLLGASVIGIDPPELATVADNLLTFVQAGAGTVSVQTGAFSATQDVTIQ